MAEPTMATGAMDKLESIMDGYDQLARLSGRIKVIGELMAYSTSAGDVNLSDLGMMISELADAVKETGEEMLEVSKEAKPKKPARD